MKGKLNSAIKNTLTLSACALAVWAATSMPAMAESVELSVKGTIIPAACAPSITGEIVYDNVTAGELSNEDYTLLERKEVDFAITCDGLVKVAIKAINGQPGTVAGGVESGAQNTAVSPIDLLGMKTPAVVGLGSDGNDKANIGGYALLLNGTLRGDTVSMNTLIDDSGAGKNWKIGGRGASGHNLYSGAANAQLLSWSPVGAGYNPVAIRNLVGKLFIQAYLNKRSELDTSKAIQLNGLTTIELVYL